MGMFFMHNIITSKVIYFDVQNKLNIKQPYKTLVFEKYNHLLDRFLNVPA
jgi:hypothetical protein